MEHPIEIYARHSGGRALLNFGVPAAMRDRSLERVAEGHFDSEDLPVHLELVVLPEWNAGSGEPGHARIPIAAINVNCSSGDEQSHAAAPSRAHGGALPSSGLRSRLPSMQGPPEGHSGSGDQDGSGTDELQQLEPMVEGDEVHDHGEDGIEEGQCTY